MFHCRFDAPFRIGESTIYPELHRFQREQPRNKKKKISSSEWNRAPNDPILNSWCNKFRRPLLPAVCQSWPRGQRGGGARRAVYDGGIQDDVSTNQDGGDHRKSPGQRPWNHLCGFHWKISNVTQREDSRDREVAAGV